MARPSAAGGRIALFATALALCAGASAAQDGDPAQRGNRLAYDYAMKCFVADSVAVGDRRDATDQEGAALYEVKARKSFDAAMKLGGAMGFTGEHMNEDLGMAQASELPKIVCDKAYSRKVTADCKALGLM